MEYMVAIVIFIQMMQKTVNSITYQHFKLSPVTKEGFNPPKLSNRSLVHLAVECAATSSCEGFVKFSDGTKRAVLSIQDQRDLLMDGFQLQPQFNKVEQHWIIQKPREACPGMFSNNLYVEFVI